MKSQVVAEGSHTPARNEQQPNHGKRAHLSIHTGNNNNNKSKTDLLFKQVRLVQKQNNADAFEAAVVGDGVENVERLHHAVGRPVLDQRLIEGRARDEVEDRRDLVEALEPLGALRALAADVDELERHLLDDKVILVDAARRFTRAQHVLLTR